MVQVRYDGLSLQSAILELRKLHSRSLEKNVNLATVRMAWMKRGQLGRGGKTKCFLL